MEQTQFPRTRSEAKALGATHYFTGEPCKHGHIAPRKLKGACTECLKVEWKKTAGKRADYFRSYNQREEVKTKKHEWYQNNREKVIESARIRPAHIKKQYQDAWKQRNIVWVRADTKSRRRKHRQATPPWLTRQQKTEMREMYKMAITLSKLTGEVYVVDHIVPLRSDIVCGLHVPWNLRVITRKENLLKSNKLLDTPDQTR